MENKFKIKDRKRIEELTNALTDAVGIILNKKDIKGKRKDFDDFREYVVAIIPIALLNVSIEDIKNIELIKE